MKHFCIALAVATLFGYAIVPKIDLLLLAIINLLLAIFFQREE